MLKAPTKVDSPAIEPPAPVPPAHMAQGTVADREEKGSGPSPILTAPGSAGGLGSSGRTERSRSRSLPRVL